MTCPEITTRRLVVGGWKTRALVAEGTGTLIVLMHGFSDSADTWRPVLQELAAAGRAAVALDLPNHGQAEPLTPGAMLPQLDKFVADAIRQFTTDGTAPLLVGNSLGGALAIRAAQNPAVELSGVVPISPGGYGYSWFVNLYAKYAFLNPLMFVPLVPMAVFRKLAAKSFGQLASGKGRMLPGAATTYAAHYRRASDPRRLLGTAAPLLVELDESALDVAELHSRAKVLWGTHDKLTLASGARQVRDLPGVLEVVLLDGYGHCPQLENPGLIAGQICDFADALAGPPTGLPARAAPPTTAAPLPVTSPGDSAS